MSWQLRNLRYVEDKAKVEPTIGSGRLLYPGTRHIFSGEPESAKTLAAYAIALEEIRRENLVILADFEMGEEMAKERLREIGFADDDFDLLGYVEPDSVPTGEDLIQLVADFKDDFFNAEVTLAIYDASVGAYDLAQLDDGKRDHAEKFARLFVRPFWNQGIATIVIDHVTKSKDSRGRYSIGSERKLGGADVHLGFEVVQKLRRGESGLMRIINHKDRRGFLPWPRAGELHLSSDPDTHAIAWEFRPPPAAASSATGFRPTNLMERLSRQLELHAEGVTRTKLYKSTQGKRQWLVAGLDLLIEEGFVQDDGSHLRSLAPFREDNGGSPVPKPFPDGSLADGATSVPRFPSSKEGTGTEHNRNGTVDQDEVERLAERHAALIEGGSA